jgi:hypothetical protein
MDRSEEQGTVTAFTSTPMNFPSEDSISIQDEPNIDIDLMFGLYDDAFSGIEELAPIEEVP